MRALSMPFEVNINSFPNTMRLSGALSSKLFYLWAPQRSLIVRRSSSLTKFITYDIKGHLDKFIKLKALNEGSIYIKETNFDKICAKFPSIKIGYSPPIQLYEANDEELEKFEKFEKVEKLDKFEKVDSVAKPEVSLSLEMESSVLKEREEKKIIVKKLDKFEKVQKFEKNEKIPEREEFLSLEKESLVKEEREEKNIICEKPLIEFSSPWENILDQSVNCLPGLTRYRVKQLEDSGFHTVRKLLNHFPRMYADKQNVRGPIIEGHYFMSAGSVISSRGTRGRQVGIHEVIVKCEFKNNSDLNENKIIFLHLKKFFKGIRFTSYGFLEKIASIYKLGDQVSVSGKVTKTLAENHYEIREYNIGLLQEEENYKQMENNPYPVYPSKSGLKPEFIADSISRALKIISYAIDPLPLEVLNEFNLLNLYDAYVGIHSPKTGNEADLARRRLIFDEFFYLQLGRLFQMLETLGTNIEREELLKKYEYNEISKICIEEWAPLTKQLLYSLPYKLTKSQLNAVSEIILDLKRPVPMNRLLQGDVGCGKTIVAFLACMEVIASGFQAAFMVPTELLAIQHFQDINTLLDKLNLNGSKPKTALLTGSSSLRESRLILKGIQTGEISLVIGTHSLISEKLEFNSLRIAVIDEQHRFGVIQRGRFNSKLFSRLREDSTNHDADADEDNNKLYMAPHILAMSATPIPRTLALALYGDMSLTQITDLPPGRQPIETLVFEGNKSGFEKAFKMMEKELSNGGKVYIVYPIIQESEQLPQLHAAATDYESVAGKFKGYNCGLLHGRMKADEKEDALRQFREEATQLLLATQVIEIGVDVPDASMMVVVNAERFGIAQLHQLRGRVGRGARKSRCVLLSSTSSALERLKVLEKSSDGFYLANADLLLRGPGDLLGKKQSGHLPEFPIARLELDGNILQEAHLAALRVLGTSNDLAKYPGLKAELSMRQPLCILGD